MENRRTYFKNICKVLSWPILFTIGQFFIQYIFVAIFNSKERGTLTEVEFLKYIKKDEYILKLNNYINSKIILIMFISIIIFLPLFYKICKKYKEKGKTKIFIPIILGISISLTYNILIYYLNKYFNFTDAYKLSSVPIFVQIISSGMLGPILEEYLFRCIVYNKLKEFNKDKKAIILTGIIFALFHSNIINGIYAFIINFVLIYLYNKYKTIKAPIIMHIVLNTTIIILLPLILKDYLIFNLYLLIISIFILIVVNYYLKKVNL